MKMQIWSIMAAIWLMATMPDSARAQETDRGKLLFRQCVACHSLVLGQHLTGPSLAGVYGRRAGTAKGFGRYSSEMRNSNID